MITEYLERPLRDDEIEASMAREYRIERAYNDAYGAAMDGSDKHFWADCHESIYNAVREAIAGGFDADPAFFKATVRIAVTLEAEKYATAVAEDAD